MFLAQAIDFCAQAPAAEPRVIPIGMAFESRRSRVICALLQAGPAEWTAAAAYAHALTPRLKQASAFEFANVPYFFDAGDRAVLPGMDSRGIALFNSGYLRLPFDICWFECPMDAGSSLGLLVERRGSSVVVHEFQYGEIDGRRTIQGFCYATAFHRTGAEDRSLDIPAEAGDDKICFRVEDPFGHFQRTMVYEATRPGGNVPAEKLLEMICREPSMAIYFALVLQSREKSVEIVRPKPFSSRRRVDKGLQPDPEFFRVTMADGWAPGEVISPEDFAAGQAAAAAAGCGSVRA